MLKITDEKELALYLDPWEESLLNFVMSHIEVTSWLVSADDFSSRVARGANERVSAANE